MVAEEIILSKNKMANGNTLIKSKLPNGLLCLTEDNPTGDPLRIVREDGMAIEYGYDANGEKVYEENHVGMICAYNSAGYSITMHKDKVIKFAKGGKSIHKEDIRETMIELGLMKVAKDRHAASMFADETKKLDKYFD